MSLPSVEAGRGGSSGGEVTAGPDDETANGDACVVGTFVEELLLADRCSERRAGGEELARKDAGCCELDVAFRAEAGF